LEHELDFVASQQSELEEILRPLEEPLAGAPPPDAERERIYSLAETLDAQVSML
jgi:E3 ubiquitin-protein ligase UBR4/nuclear pore complex protein Nup62